MAGGAAGGGHQPRHRALGRDGSRDHRRPARAGDFVHGLDGAGQAIHSGLPMTTRTQMELGGKNPLIVMEDADLDEAVKLAIGGGFSLTGQACTGTSRCSCTAT